MKTEGFFTAHRYEITIPEWRQKPIYLIPIGDVHYGTENFHQGKWDEFCEWAKDRKDCWYLLMGDMIDYMSSSERNYVKISDFHEQTRKELETVSDGKVRAFCESASFLKGRTIGVLGGNHYFQYQSGMTSTDKICEYFQCRNLGVASMIRLIVKDANISKRSKAHSAKIDIYAHHGEGGGRTVGTSLNKLERSMKGIEADLYIQGHDHKKAVATKSRIALTDSKHSLRLIQKKIHLIRAGGFLRGFVDGKQSYIAEGNYNPTDLGLIKIILTPKRDKLKTRYIDVHCSV